MKHKKHIPKLEKKQYDTSKNNVDQVIQDLNEQSTETCKHEWECLRDRCHNRGKGKYMAYKCRLCNKFQRRG